LITLDDKPSQRRKYARLPIIVLCEIYAPEIGPESGEILGKGCVLNYSRGGLSVVTPAKLSWGSSINLTVDNLEHKGFVAARVANLQEVMDDFYSYGLEFEGLNAKQRIRIERAFKSLFRKLLRQPPP
jgi:c-di-GMP-binding flagellar brake protein YcgR